MAITLADYPALIDLLTDEGIQNAPFESMQYKLYSNLKVFVDDTELAVSQFQAAPADYKSARLDQLGAGVGGKTVAIKDAAIAMIAAIEEIHGINPDLMPGLIPVETPAP